MSRNYLEAVAIILITIGAGFFVMPQYNKLRETKLQIAQKTWKLKIGKHILRRLIKFPLNWRNMKLI